MSKIIFKKHPITRQWRWKIIASNGRTIGASSESYWNRLDCEHNLKIVGTAINSNY